MRLIQAAQVQQLTGLSHDQLREWTVRRALIEPDAKPDGPGSRAGYSWQTVLVLRIAIVLKEKFHMELQSRRGLFQALSKHLAHVSFPALRGSVLVIGAAREEGTAFEIVGNEDVGMWATDCLILNLEPHLDVLSAEFDPVEPIRQLPLFPVRAVA